MDLRVITGRRDNQKEEVCGFGNYNVEWSRGPSHKSQTDLS